MIDVSPCGHGLGFNTYKTSLVVIKTNIFSQFKKESHLRQLMCASSTTHIHYITQWQKVYVQYFFQAHGQPVSLCMRSIRLSTKNIRITNSLITDELFAE